MRVAITGSDGFLGWHTRCALKARGDEVVEILRPDLQDPVRLAKRLRGVDLVLHLAGVNRGEPEVLRRQNTELAHQLTAGVDRCGTQPRVIYADSIQAGNGTPFGDGKQAAAEHFRQWSRSSGTVFGDVLLPNLFGEHGRPHYNSIVATFAHQLTTNGRPSVVNDKEIPFLHVQDAIDQMLELAGITRTVVIGPKGRRTLVSEMLALLTKFHGIYENGDIPDLSDPFHLALFNTYRSFNFPDHFPIRPIIREDDRGSLFECVRERGGQAHVFCSSSHPGVVRGEHFHRRKVERFLVLKGTAVINLRKLFTNRVFSFEVSGDEPAIIDMPTLWAHSITNTGSSELLTLFWASEILDPQQPDTYPESVLGLAGAEAVYA